MKKFIIGFLSKIPIFSEIITARQFSRREALKEVGIAAIFSTLPIWLFPTLFALWFSDSGGLKENIIRTIDQGELFIYSSALIGPLIYFVVKKYRFSEPNKDGNRGSGIARFTTVDFPYGLLIIIVCVLICLIAAYGFAAHHLNSLGFISAELNTNRMLNFSVGMYLFTLAIFYSATVSKVGIENAQGLFGADQADFLDEWDNSK